MHYSGRKVLIWIVSNLQTVQPLQWVHQKQNPRRNTESGFPTIDSLNRCGNLAFRTPANREDGRRLTCEGNAYPIRRTGAPGCLFLGRAGSAFFAHELDSIKGRNRQKSGWALSNPRSLFPTPYSLFPSFPAFSSCEASEHNPSRKTHRTASAFHPAAFGPP